MKQYARIDVLKMLSGCLEDSFIIMMQYVEDKSNKCYYNKNYSVSWKCYLRGVGNEFYGKPD